MELTGHGLTLALLTRTARQPEAFVTCSDGAMQRVETGSAEIRRIMTQRYIPAYESGKRGSDLPNVYGVTTGFGEFKNSPVSPEEVLQLQSNVLRSHAAGVGGTSDPDDLHNYFPAEVVRTALILRLNTFLKGHSGVRPELALFIRDMINAGVVPLVPTRGSVGSSGDLCPLAHLFVPMLEEAEGGRFCMVTTAEDARCPKGPFFPPTELRERMVSRLNTIAAEHPHLTPSFERIPKPGYKEGLALTNGAAFSTALLALALVDAEALAGIADIAVAMTLEATCGQTRALDEKIHRVRGMRGQCDSATNIRRILNCGERIGSGELLDRAQEVQDVYSVRCSPQVHGASRDALSYAKMIAEAEINAATDNPLFFPGEHDPCDVVRFKERTGEEQYPGDDRAYSAGNFHGQPIGLAADFLAIALAELADISERRTQMLLDKHHNRGLPPCLTYKRSVNSGFMLAQYCAAGLVSENKVLAHPATVDSIPTSANSEDHVAMASIAARKLRTVLANVQSTLAIELMVAAQALEWRALMLQKHELHGTPLLASEDHQRPWEAVGDQFTKANLEARRPAFARVFSQGTYAALDAIRRRVDPLCDDRVLAEDIRVIRRMIEDGTLLGAVERAPGVGCLRPVASLRYAE